MIKSFAFFCIHIQRLTRRTIDKISVLPVFVNNDFFFIFHNMHIHFMHYERKLQNKSTKMSAYYEK